MGELNHESFKTHLRMNGWFFINHGSFREVFHRGNWVIKVPFTDDGALDNLMEAKAWRKYRDKPTSLGIMLAPCRLLPNGCLLMVAVDTDNWAPPSWNTSINGLEVLDKNQAGFYKGRVVAYDFGLDLTERLAWEEELGLRNTFFQNDWAPYRPHLLMQKEELHASQDHQRSLGSWQEHLPANAAVD